MGSITGRRMSIRDFHRFHWTDEHRMPDDLVQIMNDCNAPADLRRELLEAKEELEERGAATYPTIARISYYIDKNKDYVEAYLRRKLANE